VNGNKINSIHFINQGINGNTLYVGGSGEGNYSTIQSAIDAANPGDTIFVYNGTYYENVNINKDSISLIGEDKKNTIIDGGGIGDVISIINDGINISEFTIRNSGSNYYPYYDSGIDIRSNYNSVINNNISNNNQLGIFLNYSNNNNISNNTIKNNYERAIYIYYSNYNIVSRNNLCNISSSSISLGNSNHNIISNNFINNSNYGIAGGNNYNNLIIDNMIENCNDDGIAFSHSSNFISNNTILNVYFGINLAYSYDNNISYNVILNSKDGIFIHNSNETIIFKNTINEIDAMGIDLHESDNNLILNNHISKCNKALNAYGIRLSDSSENRIMKNNLINNRKNAYFIRSHNYWRNNYWDRSRLLPYLIFGEINFINYTIPWFNIDWRPALEKYEI
jgi:parallel beta-helix repeat protein